MRLALALALAVPAAAFAKAPPVGAYDCTIGSSYMLFGTIAIKSGTAFTYSGKPGTFTTAKASTRFKDSIVGYTLRFSGTDLNRFSGRWYKSKDGTPAGSYEIALKNPTDGSESIYCDIRK